MALPQVAGEVLATVLVAELALESVAKSVSVAVLALGRVAVQVLMFDSVLVMLSALIAVALELV